MARSRQYLVELFDRCWDKCAVANCNNYAVIIINKIPLCEKHWPQYKHDRKDKTLPTIK